MTAQSTTFITLIPSVSARPGLLRRLRDWVFAASYTVALDPHLAHDIGRDSYEVRFLDGLPGVDRHE